MTKIDEKWEKPSWHKLAENIREILPDIDEALAKENIPISKRSMVALSLVFECLGLEVDDWSDFLISENHSRFLALVNRWYKDRYGDSLENEEMIFRSLVVVGSTPFSFKIRLTFTQPGEKQGTIWVGWTASLHDDENPLSWISNGPNLEALSSKERQALLNSATETANAVRSINIDLISVIKGEDTELGELASSARANLSGAAIDICGRDLGRLRNAGWQLSQAVEKSLKLYIRRMSGCPPRIHDLNELAAQALSYGELQIESEVLSKIPSGSSAVNLRYGGKYNIEEALCAYFAALKVIQPVAFAARESSKYDLREARFLLATPPWFKFDTDEFLNSLSPESTEDQKG